MNSASEDRWRDLRPDPENDTPLYLQLARKLGNAIHENRWRFSEMLRRRGFSPSSQWISREIVPANRDEVIQLGLSPAAAVTRLRRLRLADGIVMAVENSTFPAAVIPDPQAIGDSLYSYLEQRGLGIVRALQHFRAVNASDEIAQQMSIAPNEALLLITRVGYTSDQRAIELTDTYCRNDYYDFVAELRK